MKTDIAKPVDKEIQRAARMSDNGQSANRERTIDPPHISSEVMRVLGIKPDYDDT